MGTKRFYRMNKTKGFSLVELVAVILILGVLGSATFQYIEFGSEIYINANLRQQKLSESRFLIERISREVKGAVPNSVRIAEDDDTTPTIVCIEFVPIKSSGAYRTDADAELTPISPNAANDAIDVVSWNDNGYDSGDRMYIYATDNSEIYGTSDRMQPITGATADAADLTGSQYQISFDSNVQFAEESPINRYYTADNSVAFCLHQNVTTGLNDMYRYEFFDFASTQNIPLTSTGVLMAEGLTNDLSSEPPFEYESATLTQNSVVNLYLEFEADESENMFYNYEIHIPNVP